MMVVVVVILATVMTVRKITVAIMMTAPETVAVMFPAEAVAAWQHVCHYQSIMSQLCSSNNRDTRDRGFSHSIPVARV